MADEQNNEAQEQTPQSEASQPDGAGAPQEETAPAAQEQASADAQGSSDEQGAPQQDDRQQRQQRGGGRGRGGDDRGRRGGRGQRGAQREEPSDNIDEEVVKIYRCATVVRGGRRFSFAALVVVGDRNGRVGVGYGKANEVPNAVEKATKSARRNMIKVRLDGTTIPHQVLSKYRASKVVLVPASEGTGVIAGASVRSVMELAGVHNVLTKSYGSTSPKNLVKAAWYGLQQLRDRKDVEKLREVSLSS